MSGNSAYLTNKRSTIMKLAKILKRIRNIAKQMPESEYENVWLQRSKANDDGTYTNQTTNVDTLVADTSDEFIYNIWARATEDGLADMDKFVEVELLPKGMRLLQDTELVSSDKGSVRYMIARNIAS